MVKTFVALVGVLSCIGAVILAINLRNLQRKALSLDDTKTAYGAIAGDMLPCSWESQAPKRVMTEAESQAIMVQVTNKFSEPCSLTISLRAPGFDINPSKDEQTINLAANSTGSLSWILTPRKTGTFDITTSDIINTKIFGLTVTDAFGLSAVQAKIVSIAGTIFGPMLTVPWWWERLKNRKSKSEELKPKVAG